MCFVTRFIRNEFISPDAMSKLRQVYKLCHNRDVMPDGILNKVRGDLTIIYNYRILLQKNPGAIRHPEEDKGLEVIPMELMVDVDASQVLSPYISSLCAKAKESTFTRDSDLKLLSRSELT